MRTKRQNERLTEVGPATPMGKLLRRYWQPVAPLSQLVEKTIVPVKILGEDLLLFRSQDGIPGLIANRCAHRRVELRHGFIVEGGIRCPYHGWTYDTNGQCVAQPAEPDDSSYKDKIKLKSYPVQELSGILFAYLGPQPAPLLNSWDRVNSRMKVASWKSIGIRTIPCNWLQVMDNGLDYSHSQWLHGDYYQYVLEKMRIPRTDPKWRTVIARTTKKQKKLAGERFEYGYVNRFLLEGEDEATSETWRVGHPAFFPNVAALAQSGTSSVIYTVPVDDVTTLHLTLEHYYFDPAMEVPKQDLIPYYEIPWLPLNDVGQPRLENVLTQDNLMFVAQGEICDRTQEHLGTSDRGIIAFHQLLEEQMKVVEKGETPMNVFRSTEQLDRLDHEIPPPLAYYYDRGRGADGSYYRGSTTMTRMQGLGPYAEVIEDMFEKEARLKKSSNSA